MGHRHAPGSPDGASYELHEARARLDALLDLTADAVVSIDAHGVVDTFNRAAERLLGYSAQEVIGRNVSLLMPEPHASAHDAHMERYLRTGESRIIGVGRETAARHRDGTVIPIALAVTEARVGGRRLFTGVLRDLGDKVASRHVGDADRVRLEVLVAERTAALLEANRRLETLAATDPLTGLANRRRFDEALDREVARALRSGLPLSLILFDLDGFKLYNDAYGHPTGDRCLQAIARAAQAVFRRAVDLAARYGGEEFAVLLPEIDEGHACSLAERLRRAVCELDIPHERSPVGRVTLSLGVAALDSGSAGPAGALLQAADAALYRAKRGGRDQVCSHG